MNRLSIRTLTWATVIAALFSAWLLASEDMSLSDMARSGTQVIQSR